MQDYILIDQKIIENNYEDKTILFIFAGREDRMSLLLPYLKSLITQNLIDYVHIWNFARTEEDFIWIQSLKKENKFVLFSTSNQTDLPKNPYQSYKAVYKFYSMSNFKDSYFIKCDDDIVYIDTSKDSFNSFLNKIKTITEKSSYYLVSANVINNGVCAYAQQNKCNLIPNHLVRFPFPNENNKLGHAIEKYWKHGKKSQILHEYFIANKQEFISDSKKYREANLQQGIRFSINFIGFKQNFLLKFMLNNSSLDDEHYLTVEISKLLKKNIIIWMPLVVSHLSYQSQTAQNDVGLLKLYKTII